MHSAVGIASSTPSPSPLALSNTSRRMPAPRSPFSTLIITMAMVRGCRPKSDGGQELSGFSARTGTSKIFYNDPTVLYVSLHATPDYPCAYEAFPSLARV